MSDYRFPVEAGQIMLFARALGGADAASGGATVDIVAPPTFVQCSAHYNPDYPLRPRPGEPWLGSGGTPSGLDGPPAAGGSLHAEQHYIYHRPVNAGEVLNVSTRPGDSWDKASRRGGRLHFSETVTEYRDEAGRLVVTARSVGVRTETTPDNDDQ